MPDYLGEFELVVILAAMRARGPASALTIYDAIVDVARRDASIPAVHVTLARLERKGMIKSGSTARDGRTVKVFHVTAAGERAVHVARGQLERLWRGLRTAQDSR